MLSMILLSICSQAMAWEDVNSDGIIVRMCPPPGRKMVMKPDSTFVEACTGYPFRDLMENPEDWNVVRSKIDYFGYYCWILDVRFNNEELSDYFTQLNNWGLLLDLEVMTLKDQEYCTTGEECYNFESTRWNRFDSLGANIVSLSMDEPYTASDRGNLGQLATPPMSDLDYAVRETADWLELVQADPVVCDAEICLIESYFWFNRDELIEFIEELEAECESRGIDFIDAFSVDHQWLLYGTPNKWGELIELENYCENNGLPFSYIIWPARSEDSTNTDQDFYNDVMYQGREYFRNYGGSPYILDFKDWNWVPRQMVPEYWGVPKPFDEYPFTWVFHKFYDTYLAGDRISSITSGAHSVSMIESIAPNPSRSGVVVNYTCSEPNSSVRFLAFDIAGGLVREESLVNSTEGNNKFSWDGRNNSGQELSTGIYFVQIVSDGNVSASSKVLIVDE